MKRECHLSIDTTKTEETIVELRTGDQTYTAVSPHSLMRAQIILPSIQTLLAEHGYSLSDVSSITVAPGPGSFTGLRVGFAVGNMLAVLLGIPINGKQPPQFPVYTT